TRIYAKPIVQLLRRYRVKQVVSGMAHITGGGLGGNVNRALPDDVDVAINTRAWAVPPVFEFIKRQGNVDDDEMMRVFNMGIGFVLIVRPFFADSVQRQLEKSGETVHVLGKVVRGTGRVRLK
ncbi:MAG: AIR synthase-related protein, partial [Phycisphaeraceae bacterium]|nr:AIR synthase-related protein [Phycisphaeraceae bacterium]